MLKIKSKKALKIVTGYSGIGGSTILFIELCNLFNKHNMPCTFYGPDDWHLVNEYCMPLSKLVINPSDHIISHLPNHLPPTLFSSARHLVLSTHEKAGYLLNPDKLQRYKAIVFASQSHLDWHGYYRGPQEKVVIPTPHSSLKRITKIRQGVAGVIGQICVRKQTHVSILRALKDGYEKVILFGATTFRLQPETYYFENCVKPLLSDKVIYYGEMPMSKKQEMYEMISCVYHSAREEVACLVQGECELVGIPFYGNCNTIPYEMWPNEKIIQAWRQVLNY